MNFKTFKLLSFLTLSLVAIGLTAFKTSTPSKLPNFEPEKWHYYHIIIKPTLDSVYCRSLLVHGTCLYAYDDSLQTKKLLTCDHYVIWFKNSKTSKL